MQKFHNGDLVRVAKNLGECMVHFTADCDAIVMYSYAEKYGGETNLTYSLFIKGKGECSWYNEDQLTLIEHKRLDLLKQWQKELAREVELLSDLDWIFAHGEEVLKGMCGATADRLAKDLGINMWGSNGEGYVYYGNALRVISAARQFLERGDKEGWLKHCESFKKRRSGSTKEEILNRLWPPELV
jgi:hypothetical protein